MKALTCEMCGSQDMVKQDGYFICQHCGTKYSVEEAKKLMIEGTVEVHGTVKVDDSDIVKKHLANARRAKLKKDWEETAKYYNLVEENDPQNIEALFFSQYAKVMQASFGVDPHVINKESENQFREFKILENTVSLIDDYYDANKSNELPNIIKEISNVIANYRDNITRKQGHMTFVEDEFFKVLVKIVKKDPQPYLHHLIILHGKNIIQGTSYTPTINEVSNIMRVSDNYLKDNEPDYVGIVIPSSSSNSSSNSASQSSSGGGCYVATAVYGSYDCPEVWTLRRFRDYTLAESVFGRLFIRLYYAVSPTLVKWFGKTEWFKNLWKPTLDKMVAKLNADGVEDTPYEDKNW